MCGTPQSRAAHGSRSAPPPQLSLSRSQPSRQQLSRHPQETCSSEEASRRGRSREWGGQCANTGVEMTPTLVRGTANLTVRLVGQGKFAARFNLPAAAANNACELLNTRSIGLGTDDYYGLMVLFPKKWREPSPAGWGLSIAQLSFQGIWGAPVSLNAHARHISLELQSGLCAPYTSSHPGCTYSSGPEGNVPPMVAVPAPLALGIWHEIERTRPPHDRHIRNSRGLAPSEGGRRHGRRQSPSVATRQFSGLPKGSRSSATTTPLTRSEPIGAPPISPSRSGKTVSSELPRSLQQPGLSLNRQLARFRFQPSCLLQHD